MNWPFPGWTLKGFVILEKREIIPKPAISDTHGGEYASKSPSRILQTQA